MVALDMDVVAAVILFEHSDHGIRTTPMCHAMDVVRLGIDMDNQAAGAGWSGH